MNFILQLFEKFITGTLKVRLYRCFSEEDRLDWNRVLPRFLQAINASVNKSTGMAPNQKVWERLCGDGGETDNNNNGNGPKKRHPKLLDAKPRKRMLRVGDYVRIKLPLEVFDKGYFPRFSDHIYRIAEAHATWPDT